MKRLMFILLFWLLWPSFLHAQAIQQSGNVTPTHLGCWTTSGVQQDCGTPANPFGTTLGLINGNLGAFGVNNAAISGAYTTLDYGVSSSAAALRDTAFGGASHIPFQVQVNGNTNLSLGDQAAVIVAHQTAALIGSAPVVTSGSSDCGTAPAIVGNDTVGRVTVGSSTNGSQCTVTFATAYTNVPICNVANETSTARPVYPVPTKTTIVLKASSTISAADSLVYQCTGYQ